jgi:hypothetical protein
MSKPAPRPGIHAKVSRCERLSGVRLSLILTFGGIRRHLVSSSQEWMGNRLMSILSQ